MESIGMFFSPSGTHTGMMKLAAEDQGGQAVGEGEGEDGSGRGGRSAISSTAFCIRIGNLMTARLQQQPQQSMPVLAATSPQAEDRGPMPSTAPARQNSTAHPPGSR